MQIAVIGAGIIGVTTAYELASDGHEVTVIERRPSVAAETSFANAGVIASGYMAPFALSGPSLRVLASLGARHSAVRIGPGALAASPWLWRCFRARQNAVLAGNRALIHRLAHFSRERMDALSSSLQLQFEQTRGLVVLLRSARDLARAQRGLAVLDEWGVAHEVLDATRCREIEPGLGADAPLHSAIHLPRDGVGNCRQFAHQLKAHAQSCGATFRFDLDVASIGGTSRPELMLRRVDSREAARPAAFDAVVVCTGHQAARLLGPLGVHLPLLPVHGYSLTAPVRHVETMPDLGPRSGLMDERYKVAVSRLGQRLRVAGIAEIGGHPERHDPAALRTLYKVLQDWFPGAADLSRAQHWKGARPMLPDGPPVIGATGTPGVWINVGHGSSGWSMACGSARLVADQIAGRAPALDTAGLGIERFR